MFYLSIITLKLFSNQVKPYLFILISDAKKTMKTKTALFFTITNLTKDLLGSLSNVFCILFTAASVILATGFMSW